jgi:hypothetical protein
MFRMNGYVQDERYTAGAGRAGAVPLSLARRLTQGCAGAVPLSLAQSLFVCMGVEVVRYLTSGLAVNTSMYARARHPCRSRS